MRREAIAIQGPLPLNVRLLQLHILLLNMLFVLPVLVPYYRDVIGLGFREFMLGEAVFSTVVILMEVPTGWLSDVWTRKRTLLAGTIGNITGFAILWQADSLLDTLIAQGVIGIGVSLLSGTNTALLYDSLLEAGQEERYRKEEGFRHGLGLYSVGLSSLAGGFMYRLDPELPLILSILTSCLALLATLFMTEPARHREAVHRHPLADMLATARYALHGHKEIAGIILLAAALFATTKMLLWAQQPYYIMLELPVEWFGVLTACGFMLGGLGGHFGHLMDRYGSNVQVLRGCVVVTFFVCAISGLWPGHYAIALLLIGSFMWGFGWPRVQDAINRRVSSGRRATILSTASLSIHVVSIPLFAVTGWMTDAAGVQASLLTLAGLVALGGSVSWLFLKRRQRG